MKIVIDIDDDIYEYIKLLNEGYTDYHTTLKLYRAVKNGIPIETVTNAEEAEALAYESRKANAKRPRGDWTDVVYIDNGLGVGMCNQCGIHRTIDNYCPNCGADMRKEAENDS